MLENNKLLKEIFNKRNIKFLEFSKILIELFNLTVRKSTNQTIEFWNDKLGAVKFNFNELNNTFSFHYLEKNITVSFNEEVLNINVTDINGEITQAILYLNQLGSCQLNNICQELKTKTLKNNIHELFYLLKILDYHELNLDLFYDNIFFYQLQKLSLGKKIDPIIELLKTYSQNFKLEYKEFKKDAEKITFFFYATVDFNVYNFSVTVENNGETLLIYSKIYNNTQIIFAWTHQLIENDLTLKIDSKLGSYFLLDDYIGFFDKSVCDLAKKNELEAHEISLPADCTPKDDYLILINKILDKNICEYDETSIEFTSLIKVFLEKLGYELINIKERTLTIKEFENNIITTAYIFVSKTIVEIKFNNFYFNEINILKVKLCKSGIIITCKNSNNEVCIVRLLKGLDIEFYPSATYDLLQDDNFLYQTSNTIHPIKTLKIISNEPEKQLEELLNSIKRIDSYTSLTIDYFFEEFLAYLLIKEKITSKDKNTIVYLIKTYIENLELCFRNLEYDNNAGFILTFLSNKNGMVSLIKIRINQSFKGSLENFTNITNFSTSVFNFGDNIYFEWFYEIDGDTVSLLKSGKLSHDFILANKLPNFHNEVNKTNNLRKKSKVLEFKKPK